MPEAPTESEQYPLLFVLFYVFSVLMAIALIFTAAIVALELNIDYFIALLLILGIITTITIFSWWLTGKKWVIRVLNKMAGGEFFTIKQPSSDIHQLSSLPLILEEEGE